MHLLHRVRKTTAPKAMIVRTTPIKISKFNDDSWTFTEPDATQRSGWDSSWIKKI